MNKHVGWIVLTMVVSLTTLVCSSCGKPESEQTDEARTYFEGLELQSPEAAVNTFAQAFQRQDFMTVYLVLDAEAQMEQRVEFAQTFSWDHLIGERAANDWTNDMDLAELMSVNIDSWYIFDQIMLYAAIQNDLLIDLRGEIRIGSSQDSETREGQPAMDITTEIEGVNGQVIFRLVTDSEGRWRVYRVSAPGVGVDSWPSTLLE